MRAALSRTSAAAGAGAAILARLFYGLMVDGTSPLNGAWLAAGMGLLLALPVLWLMRRQPERTAPVLLVLLLFDAASAMECAAFSASFLAFSHVPVVLLMLPLALAALRCVHLGGDALGASARVWLWVLGTLMIVVVAGQLPYYHPAWVFPLLGDGAGNLLRSGLRCAGWIAALAGAAMLLCRETPRVRRVTLWTAMAVAGAAALMLLRLMMAPAGDFIRQSREVRVDSLLTNGRALLYMQLPMIVIWFMAMLHLACFECAMCAALLERRAKRAAGMIVVSCVLLLAATRAFRLPWLQELTWPVLLLTALISEIARRRGDA